jgi:hypothetical protein
MKNRLFPVIITIRGQIGTGKSPWASELFENDPNFLKKYSNIVEKIKKPEYDIGILAICANFSYIDSLSIQITPALLSCSVDILSLLRFGSDANVENK